MHCGSKWLEAGTVSVRCPICGEVMYLPDADRRSLWQEHRHGLMFRRGGWRLMEVIEPPAWFLDNVI